MKNSPIKQEKNALTELTVPLVTTIINNYKDDQDRFNYEKFGRSLQKSLGTENALEMLSKNSKKTVTTINEALADIAETSGALETLIEKLIAKGFERPKQIKKDTFKLISEVAKELLKINKKCIKGALSTEQTFFSLKQLDNKLLQFVVDANESSSSNDFKRADFLTLNEQHHEIAKRTTKSELTLLKSFSKGLKNKLQGNGLFSIKEVQAWKIDNAEEKLTQLSKLGLIDSFYDESGEKIFIYAKGDITPERFESLVSVALVERICRELENEFRTKYSGDYKPIGIYQTREDEIPRLLDKYRLKKVANAADVNVSLVVLALKYLEQYSLVERKDSGFILSKFARRAGLKFSSIRFAAQKLTKETEDNTPIAVDDYLSATQTTKNSWSMPTYRYKTKSGGLPEIFSFDEALIGNSRIDPDIVARALKDINRSESAIVLASNLLQGYPAAEPTAMRTSLMPEETKGFDLRNYNNQLAQAKYFFSALAKPVITLLGINDLKTADEKASVQRERDIKALLGSKERDEATILKSQARLNAITERAQKKYNAPLQAELFLFYANIVIPLEIKLGRELMNSDEIHTKIGLEMNESEIVRDIAHLLANDKKNGGQTGIKAAERLYSKFFALPGIGQDYLEKVQQVLYSENEEINVDQQIARAGVNIQFLNERNEKGLSLMALPRYNPGVSELAKPFDKIISLIKTRLTAGKDNPDMIYVGGTDVSGFAVSGNTGLCFGNTLQASSFGSLEQYGLAPDRISRREKVKGTESAPGFMSFADGMHRDPKTGEDVKTGAYTFSFMNSKILKVLNDNERAGRPQTSAEIFVTSDWQIGSPTAVPSVWFQGIMLAILNGQKDIVLNGDLIQGQNYGRAVAEMQLTGLVGIEDQTHFVKYMFDFLLKAVREMREKDPSWDPPKFTIVTGNHETNSQSNRGGQGIWFLQALQDQLQSFYRGAFGDDYGNYISYPRKFESRDGIPVDYSHTVLTYPEIGLNVAFQHYVGLGAKGSSITPPIHAAQAWARSMEGNLYDIHLLNYGHWHTQSIIQSNGLVLSILGACAGQSGFEQHLGYPDGMPSCGIIRLYSHKPPEIFLATKKYLELQEQRLVENIDVYKKIIERFGDLDNFIEAIRLKTQKRDGGGYFSYKDFDRVEETNI